jgi:hypothetical protein
VIPPPPPPQRAQPQAAPWSVTPAQLAVNWFVPGVLLQSAGVHEGAGAGPHRQW